MSLVVLEGIRVEVAERTLLGPVDLRLERGEVVALVGPNGAGKSTLLGVLSGERRPSAGRGTLRGRAFESLSALDWAELRAHLPQRAGLQFPFPVRDVVALGRLPFARAGRRGWTETDGVVASALALVGALELAERNYLTLSGGEQQRVQLARVLAQVWPAGERGGRGGLLLLDEPTSSLDWGQALKLGDLIRTIAQRGLTVVAVLHDLKLASRIADRVVLLDGGLVRAEGPPEQVCTPEILSSAFAVSAEQIGLALL